jgi:hypothetical protein
LSVCKKPSDCIFKQYTLNRKSWSCPEGTRALLPKDDRQGVMVSAFTYRKLGFGVNLTADELDKVNIERRKGKRYNYVGQTSAKIKQGTVKKSILTESLFLRLVEYSANNEGCWTYESMVMQLEDCVNCLQVLHPNFDFVFYLITQMVMIE